MLTGRLRSKLCPMVSWGLGEAQRGARYLRAPSSVYNALTSSSDATFLKSSFGVSTFQASQWNVLEDTRGLDSCESRPYLSSSPTTLTDV